MALTEKEWAKEHPELFELENLEHYLSTINEDEEPMDEEALKRYNELCDKRDRGEIK